jgi:hypothetical protein
LISSKFDRDDKQEVLRWREIGAAYAFAQRPREDEQGNSHSRKAMFKDLILGVVFGMLLEKVG